MAFLIGGANSAADTGYNVANSCRFNFGDDPHMYKTPGSDGDRKTWTFSIWCKRGNIGVRGELFGVYNESNDFTESFRFTTDDKLFYEEDIAGTDYELKSTRVFRDPSAWYHIVLIRDTTESTEANRVKLFVNGVQDTLVESGLGFPAEDGLSSQVNQQHKHYVGSGSNTAYFFDGYLAEAVFIDGTAYAATSFGEFDEDSPTIWKPIDVSGLTFGTNGFYLDFEDSANLGNDANGGTDLTEVNVAATDQASDSPTNNFATLNPIYRYTNNMTYTEGNVKVTGAGNSWQGANSTFYINKGKWFFEVKFSSATDIGNYYIGWTTAGDYNISEPYDNGIHYYNADSGEIYADSSALTTADYGTFANGDVMGMALDYDNSLLTVYKNGSALVSDYDFSSATTTAKGGNYVTPTVAHYGSGVVEWNFGNPSWALSSAVADAAGYGAFEYAVPSGYFSLCTKNLATYG